MRTADNWNREQFGNIHDPQNFIKAGDFTKKESILTAITAHWERI